MLQRGHLEVHMDALVALVALLFPSASRTWAFILAEVLEAATDAVRDLRSVADMSGPEKRARIRAAVIIGLREVDDLEALAGINDKALARIVDGLVELVYQLDKPRRKGGRPMAMRRQVRQAMRKLQSALAATSSPEERVQHDATRRRVKRRMRLVRSGVRDPRTSDRIAAARHLASEE